MVDTDNQDDRPVWAILWRQSARMLGRIDEDDINAQAESLAEKYPMGNPEAREEWWRNVIRLEFESGWRGGANVIRTPPGSGKSRDATELVNFAHRQHGLNGLYLMLSHHAINERLAKMAEGEEAVHWTHWHGHETGCERFVSAKTGYSDGTCDCGRGRLDVTGPTIAPIEYVLPGTPGSERPLTPLAERFDFWVIDEIDFRRLLGQLTVSLEDVQTVAADHPQEPVSRLASTLAELMVEVQASGQGNALNGQELSARIDDRLGGMETLRRSLAQVQPTQWPWTEPGEPRPHNFPPILVPVLLTELANWANQRPFNPRIHIAAGAEVPEIRVWWRKDLRDAWEFFGVPTFVLDATADVGLLSQTFEDASETQIPRPSWPENVHVHQWGDDLVTRNDLKLRWQGSTFNTDSVEAREVWYQRVVGAIDGMPKDWAVGIVTHMAIEQEARDRIVAAGFEDVRSLHYGDERGSNELESVRVLILLGLPIPNPRDFTEEVQAYLHDAGPLEFDWELADQRIHLRGGISVPISVRGYWRGRVGDYYRQKVQYGLYQALHRIRPYIPTDDERHVFLFTKMPVPGVLVDELLGTKLERPLHTARALRNLLDTGGGCTGPELVASLKRGGQLGRGDQKWIERHGEQLAESVGADFERGGPGRANRWSSGKAD